MNLRYSCHASNCVEKSQRKVSLFKLKRSRLLCRWISVAVDVRKNNLAPQPLRGLSFAPSESLELGRFANLLNWLFVLSSFFWPPIRLMMKWKSYARLTARSLWLNWKDPQPWCVPESISIAHWSDRKCCPRRKWNRRSRISSTNNLRTRKHSRLVLLFTPWPKMKRR